MKPLWKRSHRCSSTAFAILLATVSRAAAGSIDICECAGSPQSLGEFQSSLPDTYPPGTMREGGLITIPLPVGGKLIFDGFVVDDQPGAPNSPVTVVFAPSDANDPVRLLVAGDVSIEADVTIDVSGSSGIFGQPGGDPAGGRGGPGGFRGGDGGYELASLTRAGGAGLGPGGGLPGIPDDPSLSGLNASFVGNDLLVPLVGGSGGGGGSTSDATAAGGGGGGGGGAMLIAANGTLRIDGQLLANGGTGAGCNFSCGAGGSGSGGAIRLVADVISGAGQIRALGGANGSIRMEHALANTFPPGNSAPVAKRASTVSPVSEMTPELSITTVGGESLSLINGQPISTLPQGYRGLVDVTVDGANPVNIELRSEGLAGGVSAEVRAKPRVGGEPIVGMATLGGCSPAGICTASTSLNLPAGQYFIEAQVAFR